MIVETQYLTVADCAHPLALDCGIRFAPVTLAYETYGRLNAAGDNAILIVHGFTADAHAAGIHHDTGRVGWWDDMIGSGKAFDTDRYFVVSSNVIGGCGGSTGPSSIDPLSGSPYGLSFPVVTIRDMVEAQYRLLTALGVTSLATISGASMGGQQALQWMISYPSFVRTAIPIACSAKLSALALALSEVSRQAILTDPNWRGGSYYGESPPAKGLALARMAAHLTYVSRNCLETEFGRQPWDRENYKYRIAGDFEVQSYLRDEGDAFIERFDANSFLYLSQAIDYFDITKQSGSITGAFEHVQSRVLLISFSSDWLFPVAELSDLETALRQVGIDATHTIVETPYGHDAFLTDWQKITPLIADFLSANCALLACA